MTKHPISAWQPLLRRGRRPRGLFTVVASAVVAGIVVGVAGIAAPVAATAAVARQPLPASNVASTAVSAQVATSVPPGTEVVPLYANFALDGKATFQPSSGEWRFTALDGAPVVFRWGEAGDVPVVGDFNGNAARDDLAVWRPSNGTWYIWYDGGTGIQVERQWGAPGDVPLVGDFNANSSHDLTVWRPSNGTWYIWYDGGYPKLDVCQPIISNRGCQASFGWGLPGDIPVATDFAYHDGSTSSGSGPDDLAVWRPSTGTWWIWYDAGTGIQVARQWGVPGDIPLPGGYGNDLHTDLTVYRPSTGTWWIWHGGGTNTPGPVETRVWGIPGDIPLRFGPQWGLSSAHCVAGWDCIAVYRPSDGTWHIDGAAQTPQPTTAAEPVPTSGESDNSPAMPLTTSAIQATSATALGDCEQTRTGCDGGGGGGGGGVPLGGCNPELTQQSNDGRDDNPEFGGGYATITFGTRLACTSGIQLTSVRIQTQLWDRTGGGRINALAKAPERTSINIESTQTVDLYDVDYYPAAQQAEVVQLAQLDAGPGKIWQCNNTGTLSFLWCSGVGTRYLSAVVGFHSFNTLVARSFNCFFSTHVVDDPPAAELPTKISGIGTVRCDRQANIDMQVTLFNRTTVPGLPVGPWQQMSQKHTVFFDVPANTAKQLIAEYACPSGVRNFGEWKAELLFKADNRSGRGHPNWDWTRWENTQNLINIRC